ncbi:MAG: integrase [Pseudonocardia sp.]|nr:integrase [Pseudonocardia sp.]
MRHPTPRTVRSTPPDGGLLRAVPLRDRSTEHDPGSEAAAAQQRHVGSPDVTSSVGTPLEPRTLTRTFRTLCARHGLRRLRLHDLRHTVVTWLLELGTPPHVVKAIARHADLDVTLSLHAHTNQDPMREALDAIDWDVE